MENKKKFSDLECEDLIRTRNNLKYKELFQKIPSGNKRIALWEDIAEDMGLDGYGKELSMKYKDLLKLYRKNLSRTRLSGSDNSGITWKFFSVFNECINADVELFPKTMTETTDHFLEAPSETSMKNDNNNLKKMKKNEDFYNLIKESNEDSKNFFEELKQFLKKEILKIKKL